MTVMGQARWNVSDIVEKRCFCHLFFFFSSRRRHTIFDCDWSSDVCSSDLVAVAGDATVGLLWFDFRHFTRGSSALDTDVWFSTSRDRGVHWTERRAAGPFDLRSAPAVQYGPFIGDSMGLVGLPDGFAAAFVQARPQSQGRTDVFFSHISN